MANATSTGTGQDHERDGRVDYSDKSDPIREHELYLMPGLRFCLSFTGDQGRSIKSKIP